jgi:hypothetical protein
MEANDSKQRFTDYFSFGITVFCFISISILLRVSLKIASVPPSRLESKLVIRKYGHLFETLNTKSKKALSFNVIFVLRRVMMSLLFLFMQSLPSF